MIGTVIEIVLGGLIEGNTRATARNSKLPEFAKEADYLAESIFNQIRRRSFTTRSIWNLGVLGTCYFLWQDINWDRFRLPGVAGADPKDARELLMILVILFVWLCVNSQIKTWARRKAAKQAWRTIREKKMKEDLIRETMFQAAQKRLAIQ